MRSAFVMSYIGVVYQLNNLQRVPDDEVYKITKHNIEQYNRLGVTIAEFGTRYRHSYEVHKIVMNALKENGGASFAGTSNVHFAMTNNTKPIGTHAHEWFMFHAVKYGYKMANALALEHWSDVYRGGPIEFAQKTIHHYKSLGINPLSKTITFSDALNYDKVAPIAHFCKDKMGFPFGIGTNFTNDAGLPAMNIVMKLTEAAPEGEPRTKVVKLSDEQGKYTGDAAEIALAKKSCTLNRSLYNLN